jgi:hypothetical protein
LAGYIHCCVAVITSAFSAGGPHLGKEALNPKEEIILLILQPVYVMGSVWLVHLAGKRLATESYKFYVALKMKEREMGRPCCILRNDK